MRLKARRQAKWGTLVNSRQSGTSASPGSSSTTPKEELKAEGYDEKWLRAHFPSQLPRIFREILQGVGHDSVAYRAAVYALAHVPVEFSSDAPNEKQVTALIFYHLSLQDVAKCLPVEDADRMALSMAILSVFSIVEMKLGTYLGGLTHAKQAAALIADNLGTLSSLHWAGTRSPRGFLSKLGTLFNVCHGTGLLPSCHLIPLANLGICFGHRTIGATSWLRFWSRVDGCTPSYHYIDC